MNIFTTVNKRIVWFTLASNFFIIIAAGHGIGFLGLLEIIDFPYITKGFTLALQASDDSLPHAACLFSAIGSLLLLTSLIIPTGLATLIIRPLALAFAWIGLFYLLYSVGNGTGQNVAIVTATPFTLLSLLLLIQSIAGIIKLTRYNPPYT